MAHDEFDPFGHHSKHKGWSKALGPKGNSSRRREKLTSTEDVLQSLFENGKSPLSSHYLRYRLEEKWAEVVGPTMAENSKPANYLDGNKTLYLSVKHSVWIQQLRFMKEEIREKVNRHVGKEWVMDVKFYLENNQNQWHRRNREG